MDIPVLDMTLIGHYADGSPRYRFDTSYSTRGIHLTLAFITKEEAYAQAQRWLHAYLKGDPMGNMGEVLGVTRTGDGYWRGVFNRYHSNT
jgi:hypothetical protein